MRAGRLRHLITIQRDYGTTVDSNGRPIPEWRTFARAWARVTMLAGQEAIVARQHRPTATHEVEMYALAGLTEQMQLVHQGRVLHIEAIEPNEDDSEIKVLVTEVKAS